MAEDKTKKKISLYAEEKKEEEVGILDKVISIPVKIKMVINKPEAIYCLIKTEKQGFNMKTSCVSRGTYEECNQALVQYIIKYGAKNVALKVLPGK